MSTRRSRRAERSGRITLRRVLVVAVVGLFVLARFPVAGAATLHVTGTVPFFDLCEVQNTDTNQECYIYANLPDAPTNISVVQTDFDEDAGIGTVKVTWEAPSSTNDKGFSYLITWTGKTAGEDTAPSSDSEATIHSLAPGDYVFTVRLVYRNLQVPLGDVSNEAMVTVPAQVEGEDSTEEEAGLTDTESDDDPE